MTSDELAARCTLATARALEAQNVDTDTAHRVMQAVRDGIMSDGRRQYEMLAGDEPMQAFEAKTPTVLVDDMLEEARDLINYAVMLTVRLTALRDQTTTVGDDEDTRPACPHCGARWDYVPPFDWCPACRKCSCRACRPVA